MVGLRLRRSDHVSDAIASFHWLRVPERVRFKNQDRRSDASRTSSYGAQVYLSDDLRRRRVADIPSRGRLYDQQQLTGFIFTLLVSR
jgi:hypothetical protein